MQIELDGILTRADFEFLQSIQSAHFKIDGSGKFILTKDGDAGLMVLKAAAAEDNAELPNLGQVLGSVQGQQSEIIRLLTQKRWVSGYMNGDDYIDQGDIIHSGMNRLKKSMTQLLRTFSKT